MGQGMRAVRGAGLVAALVAGLAPAGAAGVRTSAAASPPPVPASAPAPFTVLVLGDEAAGTLAGALQAADPGLDVAIAPRPDTDWLDALRRVIADGHPGVVVVMLAGDPGGAEARATYAEAVTRLAEAARARSAPLIWVGLPIVADEALASSYADRNGLARDRVAKAGGRFVDSWDAFADEGGRFSRDGPDSQGRAAALRTEDGRGFTAAGAAKLAGFVLPDLRRARAEAAVMATAVVLPSAPAADLDVNAEIRRELGLPALAGPSRPATGLPTSAAPAASLSTPPVSVGGALVAADIGPAPLAGTAASPVQRVLVEGRPVAPQPGRIDDFAWPPR